MAAALVEADRGGQSSHGVRQLSYYWVKSARRLPGTTDILVPGELEQRRRSAADVLPLDAPHERRPEGARTEGGNPRARRLRSAAQQPGQLSLALHHHRGVERAPGCCSERQ